MASPEFEALRERYATLRRVSDGDLVLDDQRALSEQFGDLASEPVGVEFERADADGVPVLWARPEGADERRVIQYLHGGGYQVGSIDSHRKLVGHIASAAGAIAVSVGYRLTPEHRHPAPVDDSIKVYRWLLANGDDAREIALAGDSAGGGLALGTVLALRDAGLPLPVVVVAISPWTDMSLSGASLVSRAASDLTATLSYLPTLRDSFVSDDQWSDPTASPLCGDLAGLPPIYVQAGDDEVLRDDAVRFGAKASAAGVDVTFDIVPEMQHVFVKAVGSMPEADAGVARIGAFVDRWFASRLEPVLPRK